jgi:AcrR family transcriptional regulator
MPTTRSISARKKPKQARAQATVTALLDATARVLVEEGYDQATTNRIAEVAGVSIGSLYQYFPNKDALVAALVDRHETEMLEMLSRYVAELERAPLEEAVRTYVRAMVTVHDRNPRLHRVLTATYDLSRPRPLHARFEAIVRGYLARHASRLRPPSLDQASFILVTSAEAVIHGALLHRPELLREESFVEEVCQLVLRYLLADL